MPSILVTGALGNVGVEIVRQLQARGKQVRAADISVELIKARFDDSIEAIHFDFSKPETYETTFQGIEKMFLIRPPQISDMKRYMCPAIDAANFSSRLCVEARPFAMRWS